MSPKSRNPPGLAALNLRDFHSVSGTSIQESVAESSYFIYKRAADGKTLFRLPSFRN